MISIVSSSDLKVEKKSYKTFTTIIYTTGISENQELLWKDLVNECIQYDAQTGGTIPAEINSKLLYDIKKLVSRVAAKAPQLIGNFTTNLAEGWMNVRCKFDGGKFVNRSQSGSWELRCMACQLGPKIFYRGQWRLKEVGSRCNSFSA